MFLFCFSSSCVPFVASFSELFPFFDCPFGVLERLFPTVYFVVSFVFSGVSRVVVVCFVDGSRIAFHFFFHSLFIAEQWKIIHISNKSCQCRNTDYLTEYLPHPRGPIVHQQRYRPSENRENMDTNILQTRTTYVCPEHNQLVLFQWGCTPQQKNNCSISMPFRVECIHIS
jgi:hypothetical protein